MSYHTRHEVSFQHLIQFHQEVDNVVLTPDGMPSLNDDEEDYDTDAYDAYLTAQVKLPQGGKAELGIVRARKHGLDGNPIGKANTNPILDTRVYEVEFPDGEVKEFAANVIAENLYAQIDEDGQHHQILSAIIDHKKDDTAVHIDDKYIVKGNRKSLRVSTKGWYLCVEWKNGTTSWERLKDLKESNPVEVAEYAVANKLVEEPAFAWWVPYTLKRRDRIIAAVNKRYFKITHKFGIELPKTVERALEIDKETGTTFWYDAIQLEMKNVKIAFNILDDGQVVPPGHQYMDCHIIFDLKMGSLRCKARMVAGGHMVDTPDTILTYASVVSRDSVRIALTLAALNDLDIQAADIQNAYLTSPCAEKIWTICGKEFGPENEGKKAIIVRALYGLSSAAASYRSFLAQCMRHLNYEPCEADPDVWMKPAEKSDGEKVYEYILVYTDDILAIGIDPKDTLRRLDHYYKLKEGSVGDPDLYLGAKLRKMELPNGNYAWTQSPAQYVKESVRCVEDWLSKHGLRLASHAKTPLPSSYHPELDTTPVLDPERANYFQSLIGALCWMVELGRIDLTTEVSMMASHLAMPHEGHLEKVFHIYAYLKLHHNSRLVFDPTEPDIDLKQFPEADWKEFYGNVKEAIPPKAPEPRGKSIVLRCYVDSDHAGEKLTRRSRTGFLIFLNMAPITWYSKRQNTIETSTFGSEFIVLKTAVESCRGLRYKLRMMGVPISGPTYFFGDNQSVIKNATIPESTLKKKSNAIAYHFVHEAMAMDEMLMTYIESKWNLADLMTKLLPASDQRTKLVRGVLYDL